MATVRTVLWVPFCPCLKKSMWNMLLHIYVNMFFFSYICICLLNHKSQNISLLTHIFLTIWLVFVCFLHPLTSWCQFLINFCWWHSQNNYKWHLKTSPRQGRERLWDGRLIYHKEPSFLIKVTKSPEVFYLPLFYIQRNEQKILVCNWNFDFFYSIQKKTTLCPSAIVLTGFLNNDC